MPYRYRTRSRPSLRWAPRPGGMVRNFANAIGLSRKRDFTSLYPYAAAAGEFLGKRRRFTKTKKKYKTSGKGVTTQYDKANIYRKRRMPYRKRRAWKNFTRKVGHAIDKNLGTRTVVFNQILTEDTSAGSSDQLTTQLALYPVRNDTHSHLNDLKAIYDNYSGNSDFDVTNKLIFQSGILDVTVQNASIDTDSNPAGVEVDVYEISSRSSWQEEGSTNVGLTKVLQDGFTSTGNEGTATLGGLSLTQRGVTPFDACQALSQYKLKIWKKTKYFLGAGQTFTYQMRDPKRRVVDVLRIGDWDSSNMPGWTRWLLILAKTTPAVDLTTNGKVDLRIGSTRKYMYKQLDSTYDADAKLL